ncbi:peptidyl-prolyl cis-trans isomerase C [Candidatus Kinetoplastibacterium desouzaii TCC079E]|uniref:peptidylprolyl isomerase n=1 Tax=Candidatus Kinetoplastidibacterium desouzai TCC079E TaxID=1208919 RepID=M1LSC0_9PROT|nr:peptidylprolyl isomerase [Candidatus Kinetoplastibacterium desouzaii]AGF47031.1 peptidyl-prolyl cis-trans isomerase C [Candidatus Kinetoplastibacterium desouzaii TCC079E]
MKKLLILTMIFTFANFTNASTIALVNDKPITQKKMDQFIELLVNQGATDSEQLREQVKQELINREILLQAAEKEGISTRKEVQTELELANESIIVRAFLADYLKQNPISNNLIKNEYDKLKKEQSGKKEYKIKHILLDNEKQASDLISKLNKDKTKFSDMAKELSKDNASSINGGDLGWSDTDDYVESFSSEVKSLTKGAISQKPIKTQFGWHIIQLDDIRQSEFPKLEQVNSQIEEMLKQKTLSTLQQELRLKANIK